MVAPAVFFARCRPLVVGVAVSLVWLHHSASAQVCTTTGVPMAPAPQTTFLRWYADDVFSLGRLAVDADANLYVVDSKKNAVFVRDVYGRTVNSVGGFGNPLAVAVGNSRIYVADGSTGSVSVFTSDWQPLGKLGQGNGEFKMPNDIAIDPDPLYGYVYVADSRADVIKAFDDTGTFLFSIGEPGTGAAQFNFPAAIHVTANGELLVADQKNDRVQVLDRTGTFQWCFSLPSGKLDWSCFCYPNGFGRIIEIIGDSQGRIYIADAFHSEIHVFDPFGVRVGSIGKFGTRVGEFRTPVGLAIDPHNRLFVASVNNDRVDVFGVDAYADPKPPIDAIVDIKPDTIRGNNPDQRLAAYIEVADRNLAEVDLSTVTANDVAALPSHFGIGDYDSDGTPDLMVKFDLFSVLNAMNGDSVIVVRGKFQDGTVFQGSDSVHIHFTEESASSSLSNQAQGGPSP